MAADLDGRPPSVTMSRLPGEPLGGTLTEPQRRALVTAIGTLWRVPGAVAPEIAPWTDDLGFAPQLTDGARPADGLAAAAYDAARTWWDGPDPELLRQPPEVTVLGHRDPNLANYLWDGERVRIVDFEDSRVSDPATELAILVEHRSTRALDADNLCASFDVDRRRLRAARRLWAMFWLRLLLPGGPAAPRNPPGSRAEVTRGVTGLRAAYGWELVNITPNTRSHTLCAVLRRTSAPVMSVSGGA